MNRPSGGTPSDSDTLMTAEEIHVSVDLVQALLTDNPLGGGKWPEQ